MSRILMMQVLFLFSGFVYAQSDMFSLSLRLVKPPGFVNEKAYFVVALVNKTSDTTFLVSSISDASRGMGANKRSFLIPEVVLKSGETVRNIEQGFFYFDDDSDIELLPGKAHVLRLAISIAEDGYTGMLSLPQSDVEKVRVILDQFYTAGLKKDDMEIYTLTLYSNWLNVSNEDFSKVLVKP